MSCSEGLMILLWQYVCDRVVTDWDCAFVIVCVPRVWVGLLVSVRCATVVLWQGVWMFLKLGICLCIVCITGICLLTEMLWVLLWQSIWDCLFPWPSTWLCFSDCDYLIRWLCVCVCAVFLDCEESKSGAVKGCFWLCAPDSVLGYARMRLCVCSVCDWILLKIRWCDNVALTWWLWLWLCDWKCDWVTLCCHLCVL